MAALIRRRSFIRIECLAVVMANRNLKSVALVSVACIALVLLLMGPLMGRFASGDPISEVERLLETVSRSGMGGAVVVVVLLVLVAFTGVLPASLVGIVGGSLYGLANGFFVSALSIVLGAWVSFVISRSMFRGFFERIFVKRSGFRSFDGEIAKGGSWLVCLLRMSPIMPFALTSYAFGLSSISQRDYMIGTLASLPALFGYVCLGWLARDGLRARSVEVGYLHWLILGVGVAATVVLTVYVKRLATRAGIGRVSE
jgi:uncharacterized membrane protein YdjX (TVP38/TMEM64 family)